MGYSPQRIISLAPSITEVLYELGLGDKIIAVTNACDFPSDIINKKKLSGWLMQDLDTIINLQPDLIITLSDLNWELAQKLHDMQFEVLQVNPKNLLEIYDSIEYIGAYSGADATNLINKMKKEFSIKKIGNKTVYIEACPGVSAGLWVPELIKLAGGIPLISEAGKPGKKITKKEIAAANPDIIICCEENKELNAHQIDGALLLRPGPRLTFGFEKLKSLL